MSDLLETTTRPSCTRTDV